jgi:hypothetical protein
MSRHRQGIRSIRIWILFSGLAILIITAVLLLASPRAKASLRWKPGFEPLDCDSRVFFETGASVAAQRIADVLPDAIVKVEEMHGMPFTAEFRVYVCSTHQSFTEHLGLPETSPVRGIVMRDIWLSPLAFDFHSRDTHRESLTHELSHLHLRQHLGWIRNQRNIPTWFAEGLADVVANTGGEIFTRQMALTSFAKGRHFVPDAEGQFPFTKGLRAYGVPAPLLHQQSRMFVEFLRTRNLQAFREFLYALLQGAEFAEAFSSHFGVDLDQSWHQFLSSVE